MRRAFITSAPRATALRALNYSPDVEAFRRNARGRPCVPMGELLNSIGPGYGSVFTRIDCHSSHGVELLSQGDMFAAEPSGRVIRRDCIPVPADHEIRRWQVLIAGAGTLAETELYGRSLIADGRLTGRYVGPHAMVLDFKDPGSDFALYTYALLLTRVGISLVRAASYGTKILGVRKDMLSDLPIPDPGPSVSSLIAAQVRYSGRASRALRCRPQEGASTNRSSPRNAGSRSHVCRAEASLYCLARPHANSARVELRVDW